MTGYVKKMLIQEPMFLNGRRLFLSEVVMEKEINAGYEIIDRKKAGSTEIVLGYNPRAPEQR